VRDLFFRAQLYSVVLSRSLLSYLLYQYLPSQLCTSQLSSSHPPTPQWCPWSRRLAPSWDAATREVYTAHEKDAALRFAKIDCTLEKALCEKYNVQAFPSIRIFRHGTDELDSLTHQHASYYGDRSTEVRGVYQPAAQSPPLPRFLILRLSQCF
jgi:thiol-disulfide isomerase/thioredoxin